MAPETVQQNYGKKSNTRDVDQMSNGYFYGMMMSFAKNVCEVSDQNRKNLPLSQAISMTPIGGDPNDSLSRYKNLEPKPPANGDPLTALTQDYSLLLPLGMLESSGIYNDGRDADSTSYVPSEAEAGLFQVSYNSTFNNKMGLVYDQLKQDYGVGAGNLAKNPKCMTGIFGINQHLLKNVVNHGSGAALQFQENMKQCPAMAVDYMAALSRFNAKHNGPLKRQEALPRQECVNYLNAVREYAENNCPIDGLIGAFSSDERANRPMRIANAYTHPADSYGLKNARSYSPDDVDAETPNLSNYSRLKDQAAALEDKRNSMKKEDRDSLNVDERLKKMQTKVASLEKDPDFLKSKVGQLKILDQNIDTKIKEISGKDANGNLTNKEAKIPKLKSEIEADEKKLLTDKNLTDTERSEFEVKLSKKRTELLEQEAELKDYEDKKQQTIESIAEFEAKLLKVLDAKEAEFKAELDKLDTQINNIRKDKKESELSDTEKTKIKELSDKKDELKKKITELKVEAAKLQTKKK